VKRALRLGRVALHLATLLIRPPTHAWACGMLAALGVRLDAEPLDIAPGSLVVANHVSWLDALALRALLDATFVAKAEVRRWPVLGWLLERNGTLFIERRPCRGLLRVNAQVAARLARGESIAAFPESTSTHGTGVLPFKPALFEPALRGGHPVRALALAYCDENGKRSAAVAFVGDTTLGQSLWAVAAQSGLVVKIRDCSPPDMTGYDRKQAARTAHAAVQSKVCGSGSLPARQESPGLSGSGSPVGWTPSSAGPTWPSSTEVSRT
jgi:1-acyl-sn-glycerol-3-phosphate acyltransferase